MKKLIACGILFASALVFAPGCAEDSEAGRTVDCAKICSKYSECIKDVSVTSCTDECEDKADAEPSYQKSAASCETCVSDKTCKEAESCWTSCPDMSSMSS